MCSTDGNCMVLYGNFKHYTWTGGSRQYAHAVYYVQPEDEETEKKSMTMS